MKILIATESFYPNIDGGAIAQYNLAKELVKRGHDVYVAAPGFDFSNKIEEIKGFKVYRMRSLKLPFYMNGRYNFSVFPIFKLNNIIKKIKPDVTNICSPYPTGLSTYVLSRKYNIPVVGSIHLLPENITENIPFLKRSKSFKKFIWKYLVHFYNLVDLATIPTETGAKMYKEQGLEVETIPISNGIDTKLFNPNNKGEYLRRRFNLPKRNIIMYCGRISEEKRIDILIRAIPYVIKEIDAHFLFVGSGGKYKEILLDIAKELNVIKYLTFTDFLDWKDYPNIFSIADVFVMPSEAELQSIVTMEAVASGLPVVVPDKGASKELAIANNGLIFESGNARHMADCIVKILSDEKLQKKMKKNSLKLIKKHSLEYVALQYEKVYEKTIEINKNMRTSYF